MTEEQPLTFEWFTRELDSIHQSTEQSQEAKWKSLSEATDDLDAERLLSHLESPISWFTDRYTQGSSVQLAVTDTNVIRVRLFLCHTVLPKYAPNRVDKSHDAWKTCRDLAIPWYATPANLLAFGDVLCTVEQDRVKQIGATGAPIQFQQEADAPDGIITVAYHVSTHQSAVTYKETGGSVITKLYYMSIRPVVTALLNCPALNWASLNPPYVHWMLKQLLGSSGKCYCITLKHSSTEKDIRLSVQSITEANQNDARLAAMQYLDRLAGSKTGKVAQQVDESKDDEVEKLANLTSGLQVSSRTETFISNGQSRLAFFLPNEHRVDIADQFSGDAPISVHDEYKRYCDSNATDSFEAIDSVLISVRILALATTMAKNNLARSDHVFVKQMQRTAKLEAPHQQQNELMRLMMRTQIDAGARIQFPAEGFFEPAASRRKAPKLISKLVSNDIPGSHFKRLPTGMLQPVGL